MLDFSSAITSFLFRIDTLEPLDYLDIFLVTIAFYLLFSLIRRSQAAFLLRGLIALALLLLLANLLLPLPTFGVMISVALLAILITVPITLQPELRRWLEQFGRRFGFSLNTKRNVAEQVVSPLTRTTEDLSSSKTGALIVLEGNVPLGEIIGSGVSVNGQVSSELLQTVFFDKTPLHDGAVLIRGSQVVAAGCVLPLTERELRGQYRLGTRHRAAIGMSEVSDALIIVVSEETGTISVAQDGSLERGLDRTGLHQRLSDFYSKTAETQPISKWRPWQNWQFQMPGMRRILANLSYLLLSFILALIASTAVRQQNNPLISTTMTGVPLILENQVPDTTLTTPPPRTVSVDFQTTVAELQGLGPNSFQATIDMTNVTEGVYRIPVQVGTTADKVLVLGAKPDEVDVTAATIISRTIPVSVKIIDTDELSAAYEVSGQTLTVPKEVVISGARPEVERVAVVGTTISVAGATTTVEETRPLVAVDANEEVVDDVIIDPSEVDVTVFVRRRIDARDVGVRAVTTGSPPEGYWLSGLSVDPANVTLQGNPNIISEMGGFVDTLPVDLSEAVGEITVETPLDLPAEVQALDSSGSVIGNVVVTAQIAPRSGDLLVERPVELINDRGTLTVTLEPPDVTLLLSGPLPTLNEIEANPELVRVVIDALDLRAGQSVEVIPAVIKPQGIFVQLIENSVLVTAVP
jgi:diadenylate cyclase